jgi:hypothetical protein
MARTAFPTWRCCVCRTRLSGPVASHATAWQAAQAVAPFELRGIALAAAQARATVWSACAGPATVTSDFDAT